jgi:hypothetical protein
VILFQVSARRVIGVEEQEGALWMRSRLDEKGSSAK